MWPVNSLPGNEDSDQSISDVEEEDGAIWPEKIVSLAGTLGRKKESLGVASHLELLKGLHQKDVGFSSEDEVEIPDFQDKRSLDYAHNSGGKPISSKRVGSTCEVDQHISDDKGSKILLNSVIAGTTVSETLDLYTRGKGKQFQQCNVSGGDGDSRIQIQLDENTNCSTHCRYTDGDGQPQRRSTCHFQSCKQGSLRPSVHESNNLESTIDDELLDEPEAHNYVLMGKPTFNPLGGLDSEKMSEAMHALPSEYSMVELLDDLHGKKRNFHLKLGRRKGRTVRRGVVKSMFPPQRAVDEDLCEIMNSESSMDEEEKDNSLKSSAMESQRKTMADKFDEAFDSAYVGNQRSLFTVPEQARTGLFERLQQVLQRQKDVDTEFLKKLQSEVWPRDEARCIDVRIISRSYDAKLTVCHCSLLENEESSLDNPQQENFGKVWTIIFNSRVCGDVDLDVASVVRVHPPWKEVQVLPGGEILILASYFSQIYC